MQPKPPGSPQPYVSLLDSSEEPQSRTLRYAVSGIAFVLLVSFGLWFFVFRFYSEKRTALHFMDAVTAGNYQLAYQIWKPHGSSYTFKDFLADWGEKGYYGPVKSYHIESASFPQNGGSGVIVTVEISPFAPFPSDSDSKSAKDREVRLWVETTDLSMSFPP